MAGPGHCGSLLQPSMPARGGRGTHNCPRCRSGRRGCLAAHVQHVFAGSSATGTHAALARRDLVEGKLAAAGVPVAVASDNARDPFYAYGDLDPIEVFAQAVRIAQLDSPLGGWARVVTATPAGVMGTGISGTLGQGRNADLILFRARSWSELLSRPGGPLFSYPQRPADSRRITGLSRVGFAPPMTTREVDGVIVRAPVQHPAQQLFGGNFRELDLKRGVRSL